MTGSSERLGLALDGIRERWSPLPFVKVLREPLRFAHGLMNGIAVRGAGPGALGLLGLSATGTSRTLGSPLLAITTSSPSIAALTSLES